MLEDRDIPILIADVHLAIHNEGRAPRGREHVIRPMWLPRLRIEAVEDTAVIGDVENVVLDRHAAERAVHDFGKVDLAVAVFIDGAVMPYRGRVRIRPREISLIGLNGLQ